MRSQRLVQLRALLTAVLAIAQQQLAAPRERSSRQKLLREARGESGASADSRRAEWASRKKAVLVPLSTNKSEAAATADAAPTKAAREAEPAEGAETAEVKKARLQ